jgi:hypothetical protein
MMLKNFWLYSPKGQLGCPAISADREDLAEIIPSNQ